MVKEAVLEDNEPENNQSEQKAMDLLVELIRLAMKEPRQEQKAEEQARQHRQRTVSCWKCGKKDPVQHECRQQPHHARLPLQMFPSLVGQSLTGSEQAPKSALKTGSMYNACDSLVVTGSINVRSCNITIDTSSNISILRPDILMS